MSTLAEKLRESAERCRHGMHSIDPALCEEAAGEIERMAQAEPIHWRAVVQAIRAVGAEAARRGAMYPQTADEQREDKAAERRVVEMIEWYATKGGAVAMRLPDWPRHPTA